MKITKNQLRQIIQEEMAAVIHESDLSLGDKLKLGAKHFVGNLTKTRPDNDRASYEMWAQKRFDTTGKQSPTFDEYDAIKDEKRKAAKRALPGRQGEFARGQHDYLPWEYNPINPDHDDRYVRAREREKAKGSHVDRTAAAMQDRGVDFDAQNK